MASPAPTGLVNFSVLAAGNELSGDYEVVGIVTYTGLNKVPYAKITLLDGSIPDQTFASSSAADLIPGNEIEIKAGYDSDSASIFKGVIVKQSIKISSSCSMLIVDCRDKCLKLTLKKEAKVFEDQTDSDIISGLISDAGLTASVDSTDYQHPKLYKYSATDWDFIITRAEVNGLVVYAKDGTVNAKAPDFSTEAVLTLQYGNHIYELESEMDAKSQVSGVSAKSWDMSSQAVVESTAEDPGVPDVGNFSVDDLAAVVSPDTDNLFHSGNIAEDELAAWGKGRFLKSRMAKIRGRVKCDGFSGVAVADMIELQNLGDRFSGNHFVSAVSHEIADGKWFTTVQFGHDPEWFSEKVALSALPASGLIPAVHGLQIGKVKALQDDPDGEQRIQINLPMVDDDNLVWARMAFSDAGDSRGICFLPEIDDEVAVGFFNNDIRFPVVLGTLYSSSASPPVDASDDNNIKGIYSRSGIKIEFDDDNVVLDIETPGGNKITISDADSEIDIVDQNGNKISMNSGGITIDSCSDLNLNAQGKVALASSTGDVTLDGMNITASAQSQLTASGNASAEVSSSGSTSIKGSIVQIN